MKQIRMTSAHNGHATGDVLTIDDAKAGLPGFIDAGCADAFVNWARVAVYVETPMEEREDKSMKAGRMKQKA